MKCNECGHDMIPFEIKSRKQWYECSNCDNMDYVDLRDNKGVEVLKRKVKK